ncbi:MAG: hypothetical protein FJW37_12370 [Acidobacteria bacterium]|nr:hypothetical protein [Acidobacteriota bacterium]
MMADLRGAAFRPARLIFAAGAVLWLTGSGLLPVIPQGVWSSTPAAAEPIALTLEPQGAGIRIEWDREAVLRPRAPGAVLWIEDGAELRRLDLTAVDLAEAVVVYIPASDKVGARLELTAGRRLEVSSPQRSSARE